MLKAKYTYTTRLTLTCKEEVSSQESLSLSQLKIDKTGHISYFAIYGASLGEHSLPLQFTRELNFLLR